MHVIVIVKLVKMEELMKTIIVKLVLLKEQNILILEIVKKLVIMEFILIIQF
jgi:hypothetical protein